MSQLNESLVKITLIDDEREYKEQKIDQVLAWLAANNPNSNLKTLEMVEYYSDILYFKQRLEQLEQQKELMIHQRLLELEEAKSQLKQINPAEIEINDNFVATQYQITEYRKQRYEEWMIQERIKLKEAFKIDLSLIGGRFNTLMRQCSERIVQAEKSLLELQQTLA